MHETHHVRTPEDRILLANALARAAADEDLDERRALDLLVELAAAEGTSPSALLRGGGAVLPTHRL